MNLDNERVKEKLKSDECNFTVLSAMVDVYDKNLKNSVKYFSDLIYQINACLNSSQKYELIKGNRLSDTSNRLYRHIAHGIEGEMYHFNLIQSTSDIARIRCSLKHIKTPMLIKELCHKGLGNGPISFNHLGVTWVREFKEKKREGDWLTSLRPNTIDSHIQAEFFWLLFSNLTNRYEIKEIRKYVESCVSVDRLAEDYGKFIIFFLKQREELLPNGIDFILSTAREEDNGY